MLRPAPSRYAPSRRRNSAVQHSDHAQRPGLIRGQRARFAGRCLHCPGSGVCAEGSPEGANAVAWLDLLVTAERVGRGVALWPRPIAPPSPPPPAMPGDRPATSAGRRGAYTLPRSAPQLAWSHRVDVSDSQNVRCDTINSGHARTFALCSSRVGHFGKSVAAVLVGKPTCVMTSLTATEQGLLRAVTRSPHRHVHPARATWLIMVQRGIRAR
jgi:hypothetical protein